MTPAFAITIDGSDITAGIRKNLAGIRLTDKDGLEADQVEISVTDPLGRFSLPRTGVTMSVAMGWRDVGLVNKGTFIVDEVGEDGPVDTITIVGHSADFRDTLKSSREASYNGTTLGAIISSLAERNGLKAAIHADLARVPVEHLSQTSESDANLMTRLGKDYGAVATIKSGRLVFVPWGKGLTAGGGMLDGAHISRAMGDRHSFRTSDRDGTVTGINAKWTDTSTGTINFALAGKEGNVTTLKRSYPNQAEAKAAADAAWNRQRSKSHTFSVTLAIGNASICACAPLTLSGWRSEICGISWLTKSVTHDMTADGFTTNIEASEIID